MPKHPSLPTMVFRVLWKHMQAGRRFNEPNHKLLWPGFRFTAKILDAYTVEIIVERIPEPEITAEPIRI